MQKGLTEAVTPFLETEGLGWKAEQFRYLVAPHALRELNDRRAMRSRAYAVPADRTSRGLIRYGSLWHCLHTGRGELARERNRELKPFPDVVAALEKLRVKGYKLTILSNGDRDMLKAAGPHIGFPFDHVISVQEAGYFKPHWKTYAKAEEIIGHDRSSILFVANHAFDCIGAKSYGMRTVFIDRRKRPFGQTPHQPDLIVANFAELAAALT